MGSRRPYGRGRSDPPWIISRQWLVAAGLRFERAWKDFADVRRSLAMDIQRIPGVPGIPCPARATRGIQWQVHERPICVAGRLLRHTADAHSRQLSKLLPTRKTLAVHRHTFGTITQLTATTNISAAKGLRDSIYQSASECPARNFRDHRGPQLGRDAGRMSPGAVEIHARASRVSGGG